MFQRLIASFRVPAAFVRKERVENNSGTCSAWGREMRYDNEWKPWGSQGCSFLSPHSLNISWEKVVERRSEVKGGGGIMGASPSGVCKVSQTCNGGWGGSGRYKNCHISPAELFMSLRSNTRRALWVALSEEARGQGFLDHTEEDVCEKWKQTRAGDNGLVDRVSI